MSRRGFKDWRFTGDPAPLARDNMQVYRTQRYFCTISDRATCVLFEKLVAEVSYLLFEETVDLRSYILPIYRYLKSPFRKKGTLVVLWTVSNSKLDLVMLNHIANQELLTCGGGLTECCKDLFVRILRVSIHIQIVKNVKKKCTKFFLCENILFYKIKL